MVSSSGMSPYRSPAEFLSAAACRSIVSLSVCSVSLTLLANRITPPKWYLSRTAATSSFMTVKSGFLVSSSLEEPPVCHLRKSGMSICSIFWRRVMPATICSMLAAATEVSAA